MLGNTEQINRDYLYESIAKIGLNYPDTEILDKLFTMFDDSGENCVIYTDYLAACSILTTSSHSDKLALALEIYDKNNIGTITRGDVRKCLQALNLATSYFGDPVIEDDEIIQMLNDCYSKSNSPISQVKYAELLPFIIESQVFFKYICGLGTKRYVKQQLI